METKEKKSESKKKSDTKKNKLGVKNSLVNNINAKKKKENLIVKKTPRYPRKITMRWKKTGIKKKNNDGRI